MARLAWFVVCSVTTLMGYSLSWKLAVEVQKQSGPVSLRLDLRALPQPSADTTRIIDITMLGARSKLGQCCRGLSWQQQPHSTRAFSAASQSAAAAVEGQAGSEASTSTSTWTPDSQRTGVLAKKLGMTAIYDSQGMRTPVTVLQVG